MDDFLGTPTRRRRMVDPAGMDAPHGARAFWPLIVGAGLALGGGLMAAKSAKGRANAYNSQFEMQRDWQRGRFFGAPAEYGSASGLGTNINLQGGRTGVSGMGPDQLISPAVEGTEQLASKQLNKTGELFKNITQWDRAAVGEARGLAANQLNKTGDFYKSRIGQVQKQIDQVGQTARQDIADQGARQGAATASGLSRRGLGSSTMLAGAQAQNQQATGRSLSSLAEGMAGVRGAATERTTGDLANFMQFRSQYEPGLALQGREFVREGDRSLAEFMGNRTQFETGLADSHTNADTNFFSNMINAAVGGKGMMGIGWGNALGQAGNLIGMMGAGGWGGAGGAGATGGSNWGQFGSNYKFTGPMR